VSTNLEEVQSRFPDCAALHPGYEFSWVGKGAEKRRPQMRNCASGNLEIPGSMLSHRPGMTEAKFSKHLEIFAVFPVRDLGLEALDLGVLDVDVVIDKAGAERLAEERIVLQRRHRLLQRLGQ
jgi:hypothetical protein